MVVSQSRGQNLIQNPSFEDSVKCPTMLSAIKAPSDPDIFLNGWSRPHGGTSDYFSECSEFTSELSPSIPLNIMGYQYPRTGHAYAGIIAEFYSYGNDYWEYIQTKLSTQLTAGHLYLISYWVSLGEDGAIELIGLNTLGAFLHHDSLETPYTESPPLDYITNQIEDPFTFQIDTAGWSEVSGTFTATGDERWITIGNFSPYEDIEWRTVAGEIADVPYGSYCYYYIEDVCVLDLDATTHPGNVYDTSVCSGVPLTVSGRPGSTSYQWSIGATTPSVTITEPGVYWVKSIFKNECALFIDTFKVSTYPDPEVYLGNDTAICSGDSVNLNFYHTDILSYKWSNGKNTPSISISIPGEYSITAKTRCSELHDTIMVKAYPEIEINLPNDTFLCVGDKLTIGTSAGNVNYLWNTGSGDCCIDVDSSGTYKIVVTDKCGISDSDQVTITFTGCENCILLPNAFSPNADGRNDVFGIVSNCILPQYQLRIFNRWGETVFVSFSPSDTWDGTYNGSPADIGTYYYYLEAKKMIGPDRQIKIKGDITLIR